ncbi:hypothetical protein D5086_024546 [Populus alba]|uniref:Uncharacterized protein n=1 Tax=Populus alba TaxID=43335 RepID=A0ACC4B7L0_POPAL
MYGWHSFNVKRFIRQCVVIIASRPANSYPEHLQTRPPNAMKLYRRTDDCFSKYFRSYSDGFGKMHSSVFVMQAVKRLKLSGETKQDGDEIWRRNGDLMLQSSPLFMFKIQDYRSGLSSCLEAVIEACEGERTLFTGCW